MLEMLWFMPIRQSLLALIASAFLCQCQSYKPDFAAAEEDGVRAAGSQDWAKAIAAARSQAQANGMQAVVVAHADFGATESR